MTDCFYPQLYTFHYYLNLLEGTHVLFLIRYPQTIQIFRSGAKNALRWIKCKVRVLDLSDAVTEKERETGRGCTEEGREYPPIRPVKRLRRQGQAGSRCGEWKGERAVVLAGGLLEHRPSSPLSC